MEDFFLSRSFSFGHDFRFSFWDAWMYAYMQAGTMTEFGSSWGGRGWKGRMGFVGERNRGRGGCSFALLFLALCPGEKVDREGEELQHD